MSSTRPGKPSTKGTWLDAARVFVRHSRVWPKLGMAGPKQESLAKHRAWSEDLDRTMLEARRTEQTRTLFGRVRHLPDLRSADAFRRSYAERVAQNTPIQGTAADLLKLAMVRLADPVVPGARMVLTVHDELAFEVPEALADEAKAKVTRAMETVADLDVPLVVDAGYAASWADA